MFWSHNLWIDSMTKESTNVIWVFVFLNRCMKKIGGMLKIVIKCTYVRQCLFTSNKANDRSWKCKWNFCFLTKFPAYENLSSLSTIFFYKHRSISEVRNMFLSLGYVTWHWKKCLCYAFDNLINWNNNIKTLFT